jgi:hypothetical protein
VQRKREKGLADFYRRVADAVSDQEELFVAGPGEAKGEFAKALAETPARDVPVVGVEAAERMTEPQWVARVREVFGEGLPRAERGSPGLPVE